MTMVRFSSPSAHRGMALLMVLFILAIASVVLVSLSSSRQLDIRRTENVLRTAQGMDYVYGLESWAGSVLLQDAQDSASDNLNEEWAGLAPAATVQGGALSGSLTDLQGRFNLNNLLNDKDPNPLEVERFHRLLVSLDIDPACIDAILDWMDADSTLRYPNGAEDETYLQASPPYRSGNRPFADTSELLLVRGIGPSGYQRLAPYIYVSNDYEPINVNTASELVLRSLMDKFPDKNVQALAHAIEGKPFAKLEDFIAHESVAAFGLSTQGLTVSSNNFLLSSGVRIGKILLNFDSQLKRTKNAVTVLKRQRRSPEHG